MDSTRDISSCLVGGEAVILVRFICLYHEAIFEIHTMFFIVDLNSSQELTSCFKSFTGFEGYGSFSGM